MMLKINKTVIYLDLLFTNIHEDFCVTESLCPLWKNEAYHTTIEYSLFVQENNRPDEYEYEEEFQYHSANYNTIKHRINAIDWQSILKNEENVENSMDVYKLLFRIVSDEVPLKKIRRFDNTKTPVWFNSQNLKIRKQKAHKKYRKNSNNENLTNYLQICDELNLAINFAFEEYNRGG